MRDYYAVWFEMKTEDGKTIDKMSNEELNWVLKNLDSYTKSIKDIVAERREELHDKYIHDTATKLVDKYSEKIMSGKVTENEAVEIILDIYFKRV